MYLKPYQRVVRALGVSIYLLALWVIWEGDLKEGASWWVWLSYGVCVFLFCGVQASLWVYEAVTGFDEAESIYLKHASRARRHTNLLLQQGRSKMRSYLRGSVTRLFACIVLVGEKCLSRVNEFLKGAWAGGGGLGEARISDN